MNVRIICIKWRFASAIKDNSAIQRLCFYLALCMLTHLRFNVTRNVTASRIFLLSFRIPSIAVLIIRALRYIGVVKFWRNIHPRPIYVSRTAESEGKNLRGLWEIFSSSIDSVFEVSWISKSDWGMPFVRRNVIIIHLTGLNGSPRATDTIFRVFLGMEMFMEYFRRARSCSNCHEHVNAAETRNLRDKSFEQSHGM